MKEAKDGTTSLGTNSYYPVSAICEEDLEKTKECNVLKYNIFDENNIRRDIFLKKQATGQYSCENFQGLRSSFQSQFMLNKNSETKSFARFTQHGNTKIVVNSISPGNK